MALEAMGRAASSSVNLSEWEGGMVMPLGLTPIMA